MRGLIGGFPFLGKDALEARVHTVIGNPEGLVKVDVPGNVSSYGFVRFASPEAMKEFVDQRNRQGLPGDLRLRPNRPRTEESKARSAAFWQAKQELIAKGWPEAKLSVSRGRVWEVGDGGEAKCLGKLEGAVVVCGIVAVHCRAW